MKRIAVLVPVAIAAVTFLAWAESQEPVERFLIHVSWDGERVVLACEKGYGWKDLSWRCNGEVPCESWINDGGMVNDIILEGVFTNGSSNSKLRRCEGTDTFDIFSPNEGDVEALRKAYKEVVGRSSKPVFAKLRVTVLKQISSHNWGAGQLQAVFKEILEVRPLIQGECEP